MRSFFGYGVSSPPTQLVRRVGGKYAQAALMTAISLGFWLGFAIAMIFAIEPLMTFGIPSRVIGGFFWVLNVLFGLYAVLFCYIPPLVGTHRRPCTAYVSRFALGACCIGAAVGISSINIVAGGGGLYVSKYISGFHAYTMLEPRSCFAKQRSRPTHAGKCKLPSLCRSHG